MSIERRPTQRLAKLRDLIDRDAYEINLDRLARKIVEDDAQRILAAAAAATTTATKD